jgi:hypothetical protein
MMYIFIWYIFDSKYGDTFLYIISKYLLIVRSATNLRLLIVGSNIGSNINNI